MVMLMVSHGNLYFHVHECQIKARGQVLQSDIPKIILERLVGSDPMPLT